MAEREAKRQKTEKDDDESKIVRMSMMGMSTDQIAEVFTMDAAKVVKILERAERSTSKDTERDQPGSSAQGLGLLVKRLMTDPKELCCPISHELMKDPVVAEDGHTYERSFIAGCLSTSANSPMTAAPITKVLNPNQHVKTSIMSFKENTVTEIMNVAPGLAPELATKLLVRAEEFVREQLPDGSARRKLSSLLLLKMKLPNINRNETIQEIVSLLVQMLDDGQLQQFLHEADESERIALLPDLSEGMISSLCNAMQTSPTSFKVLIEKEYACRLASNLGDTERLKKMWDLLLTNSMDEAGEWTRATAVVLAAFIDRLEAPLKELDQEILTFARVYLEARQDAMVFAEKFFKSDLGISTLPQWPPHGAGKILTHLAFQLSFGEEKLQLLVEAQAIATEEAQSFKKKCEELQRKCIEQQKGIEDLAQTCKELQQTCQTLQSFSWDLSGYDFSNFSRGQEKRSDKFQICPGITARICLFPKGMAQSAHGKAAVYLNVDKAAKVKFRFRAGDVERTLEKDYSDALGMAQANGLTNYPNALGMAQANGLTNHPNALGMAQANRWPNHPNVLGMAQTNGWPNHPNTRGMAQANGLTNYPNARGMTQAKGCTNFIDSSALEGASITVDVLAVQPANSSLKFLAPGAKA